MELPGGTYAVFTYKGPYEGLGRAYQQIYGGWLPKSRYELRDTPGFEQYLNSPQNTAPENLLTLIHVPISAAFDVRIQHPVQTAEHVILNPSPHLA